MSKEMIITPSPHETKVALLEDGQVVEIYVEREREIGLAGSIYKGRVTRVLPGMQSAFVDIGLERDAFLYVSDFFEGLEEYERITPSDEPAGAESLEGAEPPAAETAEAAETPEVEDEGPQPGNVAPPEPQEVQPQEADEDRQPAYLAQEPALQLPETRPEGRGRPGRRPRRRGGRRHRGGFDRNRSGRGPESGPGRGPERGPYRGRDRGPSQGPDRGSSYGGDRGPSRGPERGSFRGGDRGPYRGRGRGRFRGPDRGPERRPDFSPEGPSGPVEPIILPGESLAKYRNRPPAPPEPPREPETTSFEQSQQESEESGNRLDAVLPAEMHAEVSEQPTEQDNTPRLVTEETVREEQEETAAPERGDSEDDEETEASPSMGEFLSSVFDEMQRDESGTEEEDEDEEDDEEEEEGEQEEQEEQDDEQEDEEDEDQEEGEEEEEQEEEQEEDSSETEVTAESETADEPQPAEAASSDEDKQPTAPAGESFPDPITLSEIQRVRKYEESISLPPSVQERTAGGVEWDRNRGRSGRPGRDRQGGRPGRFGRRRRGGRGRGRDMRSGPGRGRDRDRGRGGRGPRDRRPHARPSRGQPAIAELLHAGQEIIVQIAKEQMGKKGARITSHITLPGRFLVYMPTIDHIGISRRIGTSEERSRLRRILLDLKGKISGGFVVRTAAAGCAEEDLRSDIDYLVKLWHEIRVKADETPAPTLLHGDLNLVQRLLRDHFASDYTAVWVDNEEEYAKIVEFIGRFQPELARRAKLYTKPAPIFEEMGVQSEIDRALRPKVWLKSGGYIVINQTEALVAIDVNTGKFVGKGSSRLEDTIVKTNIEAVEEIVRQVRLRDLGGIIIIDFIDMEDPRNRHRVMRTLEDALRKDRSPSKLLSFNEFGLVAITRKRSRQSLERVLCQPCPTCTGTGMIKSIQTLSYEIQSEARKMAESIDAPELTIRAHPEIIKTLKSRENTLIHELEEMTGKNIILQSDNNLHIEEYNIY